MLHNNILYVLARKVYNCKKLCLRKSALFINGHKATDTFVYVTPHIDFHELLEHKSAIQEQLGKRKSKIDFEKLENLWSVYEELKQQKQSYDKKKAEISRELSKIIKSEPDSDTTKKFKIQSDLIKDNIKKLKAPLWTAEEAAVVETLRLPNMLHSKTPEKENQVLFTHLSPPQNTKDHLKIGREQNLINFKKNENYYLMGDAAVFELGAKFYFTDILKRNKYVQFSNPDFVKSVIVEGCGEDHTDADATFILHHNEDSKLNIDSRLHLTGGASLSSFFAYHAKNVLYPKVFPLKYFSMGRQYLPSPTEEDSLFHVSQASVIQLFGATKTDSELNTVLDEVIDILKLLYSNLGCHFRISLVSADKLSNWESLRVVLEMYSSSLKTYVNVAEISISGDYISKRLMFTYVDNKQSKFPHIISGTLLNVPRLLACMLEQDTDFSVPQSFRIENWTNMKGIGK